jgi:hypothetical protein
MVEDERVIIFSHIEARSGVFALAAKLSHDFDI